MNIFNTVLSCYVTLSVSSMQKAVLLLDIIRKIILYSKFIVVFHSFLQVIRVAFVTVRAVLLLYIAHHTNIYESEKVENLIICIVYRDIFA